MEQPNRVKLLLVKIWPTINRAINGSIYFVITLIRSTIIGMIRQIKGGL